MKIRNVKTKEANTHIKEDGEKKHVVFPFRRITTLTDEDKLKAIKYYESEPCPYIEELSLTLDVNEKTIANWTKIDPIFRSIIERLKTKQKLSLLRKATDKEFATNGVLFLLRVNHKMIDTTALDLGNRENKPFKVDIDNFDQISNEELQRSITKQSEQ